MDVHGVRRHALEGSVGENEHGIGVADGCRVLLVESGGYQLRAGEDVVVPEDE